MYHPETDAPPPALDVQPSPADSSLPHLLYSLEIATPTLVPSDSLPVHHEELVTDVPELLSGTDDGTQEHPALSVEVPEPLPGVDDGTQEPPILSVEVPAPFPVADDGTQVHPASSVEVPELIPGTEDGTQAYPVLSVEVPSLVAEIDDLPNALWFVDDNLAVVQNGCSSSNHQFLNLVATSAPDPLASSDESLYFDAETGEVEPTVFEPGVGQVERNDPVAGLAHVDLPEEAPAGVVQLARNNPGAGLALVDSPADAPASPENVASPRDREIAPVAELEHLPPALPGAPPALEEEDDDDAPLVFDPLEASPLLDSLGFSRVQRAYDRWLQNMSHSISIFQGIYFQA